MRLEYTVQLINHINHLPHLFYKLTSLQRMPNCNIFIYRLYSDLIWCYKILFGHADLQKEKFFELATHPATRGHMYKLYKKSSKVLVRQKELLIYGTAC